MSNDLDRMKELFQGYSGSKTPSSRERCPDAAEIVDSFEPQASWRQKDRIVEHIARCPLCREEFMMLAKLPAAGTDAFQFRFSSRAREFHTRASKGSRLPHMAIWRFAGALLGLGLMVSSLVIVVQQRDRWNVLRSGGNKIHLLAPKSGNAVSRPPLCRWQARTTADYYVLEVFNAALLPVWASGPIRDNELLLPSEVFARLIAGQSYFWMVTGYSGRTPTGESQMGRFVISR